MEVPRHTHADLRDADVRSLEARVASLEVNMQLMRADLVDHTQRFETLQTALWKRIVFRLDGWPGQRDLNADGPAWRPWRRWWTS